MQIMDYFKPRSLQVTFFSFLFLFPWQAFAQSQPLDEQAVIRGVDAAVKARIDAISSYTDTEHYAVFRGQDESHPAAEMIVRTTYQRDTGKSYQILSESGSGTLQRLLLHPILDREREINQPGNREASWITSANYEMKVKQGGLQSVDGRPCYVIAISPRLKAPNLIQGTVWVDAKGQSIVKLEGVASKSVSVFTGPAQVMRQYAVIDGFAEATHARAVSSSYLFGQTVVSIDYQHYEIKIRATQ
jgi:hypothetical protein